MDARSQRRAAPGRKSLWFVAAPIVHSGKLLVCQVEGDYNKVLDKCAECRDGLGPICDNIALGTALEELWNRGAPCSTPDGVTGEGDEDGGSRCCLQVPYTSGLHALRSLGPGSPS